MDTFKKENISKIDVHAHYLPKAYKEALLRYCGKYPDDFPTPDWNPEKHLEAMNRLGIAASILSLSSPHINFGDREITKALARESNEEGAALVREYPGRFGLFASLPLPDLEDSIAEIQYGMDILHADGFTLPTNTQGVYLGNGCLDPVMEELNKYKSVVAIHPNRPSSVPAKVVEGLPIPAMEFFFDTTRTVVNMILKGTMKRFPDIKFIIPHAGAFLPILSDRLALSLQALPGTFGKQVNPKEIDVYSSLKGLYYDLAGVCLPRQLPCLMQLVDTDHFLYGSDYPYTPVSGCMTLADMLDKTGILMEEQRHSIHSENALGLFQRYDNNIPRA
jgi:predicted TIM-barrel fold metal-dependent hydrolase